MAKAESISVKDAIHKMQLSLFEGIHDESQLFAAGTLMSQNDYQDVVTERSIANICGYPLCSNSLPSERPRKGRYRISLKEHKVYDLHETYMYCSTSCVVSSRSFAGSLQEERCSDLNLEKVDQIMRLFEGLNLDSTENLGRNGDLGFSELKIQEKPDVKVGEASSKEWIGPSNAIEGYVPQKDRSIKQAPSKNRKQGSKPKSAKPNNGKEMVFNEMDFMSTIITQDEYSVSKIPSLKTVSVAEDKASARELSDKGTDQFTSSETKFGESTEKSIIPMIDKLSISETSSDPFQTDTPKNATETEKGFHSEKEAQSNSTGLKPSLKSSGAKKVTRSVTWADEKSESTGNGNLCEFSELEDKKEASEASGFTHMEEDDKSLRFASAEACALALSQAAEAVASGESDAPDAVSEAGIIILPPSHNMDEDRCEENVDMLDPEPAPVKWSRKQGISHSDFFDSEDSWFDNPPDGFNLNLSPFATMFMALFSWISSSSLAYIYGQDESLHEEYLSVNGREYPRKIVLTDGRSSEIKQTLAGCLARALPGLVDDLRLPTPISTLEKGLGRLLDTVSFSDALPPFRMKQWQVIVLLFLDALSICQVPALTPHMTSRRMLFNKVLDGAEISAEEYEIMKDVVIPLGRVPQLSTQSGG